MIWTSGPEFQIQKALPRSYNRATLPQKWPPPPRNVAASRELTATTKLTELSISRGFSTKLCWWRAMIKHVETATSKKEARRDFTEKDTLCLQH